MTATTPAVAPIAVPLAPPALSEVPPQVAEQMVGPRNAGEARSCPSTATGFTESETTIIFDFDDTLFPTTWALEKVKPSSEAHGRLEQLGQEALTVLRCARCLSQHVVIKSQSDRTWLDDALRATPVLRAGIEQMGISVVCAGEAADSQACVGGNVIAISASRVHVRGAETKIVQMLKEPSLDELMEQLRVLETRLPRLARKRYHRARTRLTMHRTSTGVSHGRAQTP